ncbi:MAG: response regulator transcription factor [Anaerolineae bacterium]
MTKILLIDDDVMVLQLLETFLENEGYTVYTAKSGRAGLEIAWQQSPDLIILDLVMPLMDGFETYRRLRELGVQSVLIMSHRQDEKSVVRALKMGTDDYLRKPIDLAILRAKIETLMRRNNRHAPVASSIYNDGELVVDLDSRRVELRGKLVKLTPTEFRLLSVLLRRVGRVVSHEELIQEIWGTEKETSLGSLKLYIYYLRKKLEDEPRNPHYLLAEWGIGYRFREPELESVL